VFTGKQTGGALQELIANSYAMVHPSRVEGLSISVLEAMANGKLVIMSDIPPNLELIDHSGIAYKVGDVAALNQAMLFAISDPKMVEERGKRAREAVRQLYSWDSVVNRTEAVYFSLVKRI
jgi:glycosyltransferase involved in cell wall biosynthesis